MYLFSLLIMLLTILGLFTQILAQQNNRFAAMKTGGAQQMLVWHGAVVAAAQYTDQASGRRIFNNPLPNPGTNIVWGDPNPCVVRVVVTQAEVGGLPSCRDITNGASALLSDLRVSIGPAVYVNLLPEGYNVDVAFNSIIFVPAGTTQRLAVTFIGPDLLNRPEAVIGPIGMSVSQVFRQLKRSNLDPISYGYVAGNLLQPSVPPAPGVAGAYTLPPALVFDAATNPTGPLRSGALALFTPL